MRNILVFLIVLAGSVGLFGCDAGIGERQGAEPAAGSRETPAPGGTVETSSGGEVDEAPSVAGTDETPAAGGIDEPPPSGEIDETPSGGEIEETPPPGETDEPTSLQDRFTEFVTGEIDGELIVLNHATEEEWRKSWSQYQGDPSNSGFKPIFSDEIGSIRWRRMVGQVVNTSPVVGPDGTIYVGTAAGELLAVAPNGTQRWRRDFFPDAVIMSTPAVAADGSIFVVYQQRDGSGEQVSTLNRVSPDGRWMWARLIGDTAGWTTASPTVLGRYVYLPASTPAPELLVFDFDANLVARAPTEQCTPVCGSFIDWDEIWDEVNIIADFACCFTPLAASPYCLTQLSDCPDYYDGFEGPPGALPVELTADPTAAVTDMPSLAPDGNPLVVVTNGFCMTAFRFDAPDLEFLWQRDIYGNGCDYEPVQHTSPAIFENGQLVICNERGEVESYDPLTGDRLWEYDAGEAVWTPPAAIGRFIYIVSENHVHFIDFDGEPFDTMRLTAPTRFAPLLSANYVYAVTTETVHSIDLALSSRVVDRRIEGGASSPAIGPDGTIYVVTLDGVLIAYHEPTAPPGTITTPGTGDVVSE